MLNYNFELGEIVKFARAVAPVGCESAPTAIAKISMVNDVTGTLCVKQFIGGREVEFPIHADQVIERNYEVKL
jgi:hypothetical protein